MARHVKMTFTLDGATADRIDQTARRLGLPKSGVVREAIREYAARAGQLGEHERVALLKAFDEALAHTPSGTAVQVDRELRMVREARRRGGRRQQRN